MPGSSSTTSARSASSRATRSATAARSSPSSTTSSRRAYLPVPRGNQPARVRRGGALARARGHPARAGGGPGREGPPLPADRVHRDSDFTPGQHALVLERDGMVVYPRMLATEHGRDFPRELIGSGVEVLDRHLGGGIDRGPTTLIAGSSGAGKTTVAMGFLIEAARRGERAVAYSFEEGAGEILHRCETLGARRPGADRPGHPRHLQGQPPGALPRPVRRLGPRGGRAGGDAADPDR